MSKVKQQVRPEQQVKLINKLAVGLGGIPSKTTGVLPLFETADLPDAEKLPDGVVVIDVTENKIKFIKDKAWQTAS